MRAEPWDTIIIGGGPAGLSAAPVLGRELREAPIAVYGKRSRGLEMARAMTAWTSDIALCERRATGVQHVEHPPVDDPDVARRRPAARGAA